MEETTVLGLFDNTSQAQNVVKELMQRGIDKKAIRVVGRNDTKKDDLYNKLTDAGAPGYEADHYAEGVDRGGTLLMVDVNTDSADEIYDLVTQHETVDVDTRSQEWKQSGWKGPRESDTRQMNEGQTTLPIVEEQMKIGKRQVQHGGVRVYSRMTETPVEEQVSLREETVRVERHAVDRPVSDADMAAFKEGTIEMTETDEEAIVSKQARVVEEVVIGKEVTERVETVRDSVRRTDVQVEEMSGQSTGKTMDYASFDSDFQNDFKTRYAKSGGKYEQYAPVYRYGYDLAGDKRYANQEWNSVEKNVRTDWEKSNPNNPWEQVKDTVKYAWDKVRGKK